MLLPGVLAREEALVVHPDPEGEAEDGVGHAVGGGDRPVAPDLQIDMRIVPTGRTNQGGGAAAVTGGDMGCHGIEPPVHLHQQPEPRARGDLGQVISLIQNNCRHRNPFSCEVKLMSVSEEETARVRAQE